MRLSEVMSQMNLVIYPEIGLVLFLAIFIAVVVYTFRSSSKAEFERARHLPCED